MLKRGNQIFFFLIILSLFSANLIFAQEGEEPSVDEISAETTDETLTDDATFGEEATDEEISVGEIERGAGTCPEREYFDSESNSCIAPLFEEEEYQEYKNEELTAEHGITPDSAFYFIDEFFDRFGNDLEIREEKIAEIRAMVEAGNIEAAKRSLENYLDAAERIEKEISPEERDEALRSAAAIQNTIREIENEIPEDEREDFVNDVIELEDDIATAAEIAVQITELCDKLVKMGEHKKASEVCKLDKDDKDEPKWKKKKNRAWNSKMSDDAVEFTEVLSQCMKVTSDEIEGNYDECECDKMPEGKQDLCENIAEAEDACSFGDDEACNVGDELVNEFMDGLPDQLLKVVSRLNADFVEGCEGLSFEECFLKEAEKNLQYAPEECREPIREAIRAGEVRGESQARKICEKIMFEKHAPLECIEAGATTPDECALLFKGRGVGEGGLGGFNFEQREERGPGFDYSVCDAIVDVRSQLDCYRDNVRKTGLHKDYYKERQRFRGEFDRGQFENFREYRGQFENEFDQRFKGERIDEYADFYARDRYYEDYYKGNYDPNKGKEDYERKRAEHQELIDRIIKECSSKGLPWFCNGPPEKPCYCGEPYRYEPQPPIQPTPYPQPYPQPYPGSQCATDHYYDYYLGGCIPIKTGTQCSSGYVWDDAFKTCRPQCPSGSTWDGRSCMKDSYGETGCGVYTTQATCESYASKGCKWGADSGNCYYSGSGATACNYNHVCDYGESSGSCPTDCGSSTTCGTGYYWDSATNSCKPSGTTTYCNNCGQWASSSSCNSAYGCSWVTSTNICVCQTTCGTGYYWDSATGSCKSSGTTTTGYCATGYYWDTAANMCKPSTTTTTCGTGYYWDSAANMCKVNPSTTASSYTTQATCTAAAYFWCSTTNLCYATQASNPCSSTYAGTCGTGYYWDTATNSCKSSTTTVCGNYVCDSGESYTSCPSDCTTSGGSTGSSGTSCGNNVCDSGETVDLCPMDCGSQTPASVCGNNVCDSGETSSSCPMDCSSGGVTGGVILNPFLDYYFS